MDPEGYGTGFWRLGGLGAHDAVPAVPAGSYAMNGNRGRHAVIVPGRNIIVIRRGFDLPAAPFPMPRFAADVVAVLEDKTKKTDA